MRLLATLLLTLLFGLSTAANLACAQNMVEFPYQANVISDEALVHSGPGDVHYPTDQLSAGALVEVYRHDPGGWCAIRPVVGSFSMVPRESIEEMEEALGRVTKDGVPAWVGTRMGNASEPMWQVKLKQGETVEILGKLKWDSPDEPPVNWYQIAPPAGEFRWIKISEIERSRPLPKVAQEIGSSLSETDSVVSEPRFDSFVRSAGFETNQTQVSGLARQRTSQPGTGSNSGWRRSSRPIRVANDGGPSALPRNFHDVPVSTAGMGTVAQVDHWFEAGNASSASRAARFADARLADINEQPMMPSLDMTGNSGRNRLQTPAMMPPIGDLTQRLTDLELALTQEMLEAPTSWALSPLIHQTQAVYQSSQDAKEREQAERLLYKLRNCQQLQSKMLNPKKLIGSGFKSTSATLPIGTGIDQQVQMGTIYDAYGWLDKLVRDSGKSPSTFVIKDDSGKITHHVSPAPGLNLHRYLRQKVGVIGQRGFHQQLRLDHVTIERVVVLQKRR
ncbi:MAG: hypothetical protein MK106_09635 [Mariniblastus sp.]|nr:hypothetical protein [Mariniblastus sp.]